VATDEVASGGSEVGSGWTVGKRRITEGSKGMNANIAAARSQKNGEAEKRV